MWTYQWNRSSENFTALQSFVQGKLIVLCNSGIIVFPSSTAVKKVTLWFQKGARGGGRVVVVVEDLNNIVQVLSVVFSRQSLFLIFLYNVIVFSYKKI